MLVDLDVLEPDVFDLFFLHVIVHNGPRPPALSPSLLKDLAPLSHCALIVNGTILAPDVGRWFHALNVTPGLKATIRLFEERIPVRDTAREEPYVHIVKGVVFKRPGQRAIIDLTMRKVRQSVAIWLCHELTTQH